MSACLRGELFGGARDRRYNEQQPRRQLPAKVDHLQALIEEQLDEREAMARRIADHFGRALPAGYDIYLLVDPRLRDPGMIPWAGPGRTQPS